MSSTNQTDVLAPIEIWEVLLDNSTIKFKKPLVLQPEILPPEEPGDNTYLIVDVPELAIDAFGLDRRELMSCIRGDIMFAWKHYVLIPDQRLHPTGKKVKDHYLAIAEEVIDG